MTATHNWLEAVLSDNPIHQVRTMSVNELKDYIKERESREACKRVYSNKYSESDRMIASAVLYARNLLRYKGC